MADVDVVICCYNRTSYLAQTLPRLLGCDVILSDDGSAELLNPSAYPQIRHVLWNRHHGYQRVARFNQGLALVTAPFVILLDDDCLPVADRFVAAHREVLEACDVSRGLLHDGRPMLPPWFSTSNIGFRTEVLRGLGGFHEAYNGTYGYEDADLGKRVEACGLSVGIGSNDTAVYHLGPSWAGDRATMERNRQIYESLWGPL